MLQGVNEPSSIFPSYICPLLFLVICHPFAHLLSIYLLFLVYLLTLVYPSAHILFIYPVPCDYLSTFFNLLTDLPVYVLSFISLPTFFYPIPSICLSIFFNLTNYLSTYSVLSLCPPYPIHLLIFSLPGTYPSSLPRPDFSQGPLKQ